MIKLYYVEDDFVIASTVQKYLTNRGYHVIIFENIEQIKQVLQTKLPSLVIIDWNLTDGSGYNLCKWIRETKKDLPIIFLTVKGDSKDIIQGFQGGADDYIIKPFDLEILYARICAILKRTGNMAENYETCGDIFIDKIKLKVYRSNEEMILSQMEYQLLKLLT